MIINFNFLTKPAESLKAKISPFFGSKKSKLLLSAVLFLIFSGGLVASLVLVQKNQQFEKRATGPAAQLSFAVTDFANVQPGSDIETRVILTNSDPPQEISAVDVVINFSKEILELVAIDPVAKTGTNFKTFAPIENETSCNFKPNIASANQTGKISFGAVTFDCLTGEVKDSVNDEMVNPLALLHFRVKQTVNPGSTGTISFEYLNEGATTDSNIVTVVGEIPTDILSLPGSIVTITVSTEIPSPALTPFSTPTPSAPKQFLLLNGNFATCKSTNWTIFPIGNTKLSIKKPASSNCYMEIRCSSSSSAPCKAGQSVYQDINVSRLTNRNISFGGEFSTTEGNGNLELVVFELDAGYKIVNSHRIPFTATPTPQTVSKEARNLNSATKTLRYQIYLNSPNTFKADNLFLVTI